LILAGLAACDSTTEPNPGPQFDTDQALADYEAIDNAFVSAGWDGFVALGGRTPFGGSPAAVDAVAALSKAANADGGRSFALALAAELTGVSHSPAGAPIISDLRRGRTFVYDPDVDDYRLDPDREGAPETGVRFIIYEVDGSGRPIVEEEIGHADLVDEGDGSAEDISLRLSAVANEETVLDYRVTLDEDGNRGALTVHGHLQGDNVRLDFDIEAVGTRLGERTTLDVAFDMRVDARDFSITGSVSGVEEGEEGEGDVEVTVRHRDHSLRVAVEGEAGQLDGSVFLNGDLFATITGDAEEPTILGASGNELTFGEMLVLRHVMDTIEDVFDFLEDLLDPVDELVILAFIL
jgi:hypothetical protein